MRIAHSKLMPYPSRLCFGLIAAAVLFFLGHGVVSAWALATESVPNVLVVHVAQGKLTINKNIYGHFAEHLGRCIYEGIWVGEDSPIPNTRGIRNDVVAALRRIKIPVLRWPGGCFADEYHWRDGIGPRASRPSMVNNWWGGVTENNHFGTHEFFDLCEQLGCEPYICGNVGSGTVQEMQQWVEYITHAEKSPMADLRRANGRPSPWRLPYFGVGNENMGCGGNMSPEFYSDQYRRYNTFVRNYSGNQVFRIACGAAGEDYHWTEVLMSRCATHMNGLSLHYYCGSGHTTSSATQFDEEDWFHQLKRAAVTDDIIRAHSEIMDRFDPDKRVALIVDEWGAWHSVEPGTNPGFLYQQNSLRDALVAGITLNIFNRHCQRVQMANIAQMVNVLQAMILTDQEKMIVTPTYHVFDMYKVHQDATLLPTELTCTDYQYGDLKQQGLSISASRDKTGKIHITFCNLNPHQPAELECRLQGADKPRQITGQVLTAPAITAHNTFENPDNVKPVVFKEFRWKGDCILVALPAKSVVLLNFEL